MPTNDKNTTAKNNEENGGGKWRKKIPKPKDKNEKLLLLFSRDAARDPVQKEEERINTKMKYGKKCGKGKIKPVGGYYFKRKSSDKKNEENPNKMLEE